MSDIDLDELRSELSDFSQPERESGSSAREQRIIAGFEEIERFVKEHGRLPQHGEKGDIFERLYAVRLDQLRTSEECRELLKNRDIHGLLGEVGSSNSNVMGEKAAEYQVSAREDDPPNDDELLSTLRGGDAMDDDITQLRHVRSHDEVRAAEEVAQRTPCADFDDFKPLFEEVQRDLESGVRKTLKFQDNAEVKKGDYFILDGQKLIVAELGEIFVPEHGRPNSRLRVIYDNGTESDLLLRSLQRALNKDKRSRRITDPGFGPLFSGEEDEDDLQTGHIYVLRSRSNHPFVVENQQVLHKIGVTGGDVKARIANAKKDPTYLLADVEVVATYKLANINRKRFEALLHRFFSSVRLDLELKDRFGFQVEPKEWFLLPLHAIDQFMERVRNGNIEGYHYDSQSAQIVKGNT